MNYNYLEGLVMGAGFAYLIMMYFNSRKTEKVKNDNLASRIREYNEWQMVISEAKNKEAWELKFDEMDKWKALSLEERKHLVPPPRSP